MPVCCATVVCQCSVPLQCASAVYHCGMPVRCATAVCQCSVPVRCATAVCQCGVPVRYSTKTKYNSVCRNFGDRLVLGKTFHFSRDWNYLFVTESDWREPLPSYLRIRRSSTAELWAVVAVIVPPHFSSHSNVRWTRPPRAKFYGRHISQRPILVF